MLSYIINITTLLLHWTKVLDGISFHGPLPLELNVSGYVCNRGSPSGERDTASPRGRYGERPQRDSCLKIHM